MRKQIHDITHIKEGQLLTSQARWSSETHYKLRQDMSVHVSTPNNVFPRGRKVVHAGIKLIGTRVTLLGTDLHKLCLPQYNTAQQKMSQTILINNRVARTVINTDINLSTKSQHSLLEQRVSIISYKLIYHSL